MILKTDCKHIPGNRPCTFNKTEGQMCGDCPHDQVTSTRTLIINADSTNSWREFFAFVSLSGVFLTGHTLALHAATALGKKVVAYFGPTLASKTESLVTK